MAEIKFFTAPPINRREICRYARAKDTEEISRLLSECEKEAEKALSFSVAYSFFPIKFFEESADNGLIDLFFTKTYSKDLCKNLQGCKKIVLFAATVGVGIDRLIYSSGAVSPAKSLVFEALGSERAEALADAFNDEISQNFFTAPRFSPGYGDLSLDIQKDVFKALPCERIGLYLNDSLLMSPSKSITAIIGIKGEK